MSPIREVLLVFLFTEGYIWKIRHVFPQFWVGLALLMLVSVVLYVRRQVPALYDRPSWMKFFTLLFKTLGVLPEKHASAHDRMFYALAVVGGVATNLAIMGMAGAGYAAFHGTYISFTALLIWEEFWQYLPKAFAQQLIVNGYFLTRLQAVFAKPFHAAVATGVLFSLAHVPNTALMAITLLNGIAGAWVFSRYRNIWPLVFAHSVIGAFAATVLPAAWIHGMRVGYW